MQDDASKKVKRILAVVYLLVMAFVVGGSYLHQQQSDEGFQTQSESENKSTVSEQ